MLGVTPIAVGVGVVTVIGVVERTERVIGGIVLLSRGRS
jgi:hypothetical protein